MRGLFAAAALVFGIASLVFGMTSCARRHTDALYQAQAQAAASTARAEQAEADLARLQKAQALGDEISHRLAATEHVLAKTTKERNDALALATTGRACLRGPALRLLDGAPGIRVKFGDLPAPTSSAAAAGAAAAAAESPERAASAADAAAESTDQQVAAWALQAGQMYETCRARLGALIEFNLGLQSQDAEAVTP
jgi:prophage endopeptidase